MLFASGPLDVTVPDHLIIDAIRSMTVFVAAFAAASAVLYWRRVPAHCRTKSHVTMIISNTLVSAFCAIQEAQQIGKPFLLWRLPYIIAILALIWLQIRFSKRERGE